MSHKKKIEVALIYDFDGTLSPGNMQEFGFVQSIGKNANDFWREVHDMSTKNDASEILCYMQRMLKEAEYKEIGLRRESFAKFGSKIELFPGVEGWFDLINECGANLGLSIKHYIISSGLKEMIEGTPIAHKFENIYACSFIYDINGVANWPAVAVDYTAKTQFLFKINKGIREVSDNSKVNQYIPERDRRIPFERMIYFGDGETDIPCMKMVKQHGGHSIAVYNNQKKQEIAMRLINEGRANFACTANYSKGKDIYNVVRRILQKIRTDYDFQRLLDVYTGWAAKYNPSFE